ncbi:hypothetical protein P9139_11730 [Curtobacterium flaccumfaciens]|nr:hypothetical protein P9139_11730 [Curtobacterium flaccumfaciens]
MVRASRDDGTDTLGIVDVGSVAAHLLGWLHLDPVGSVGVGEAVTISTAQYEDRSGPCPSAVEWFRRAWAAPVWRSVNGWSNEARVGFGVLVVPGVGVLDWSRGDEEITLSPARTATIVRSVVEAANTLAPGTRTRSRI